MHQVFVTVKPYQSLAHTKLKRNWFGGTKKPFTLNKNSLRYQMDLFVPSLCQSNALQIAMLLICLNRYQAVKKSQLHQKNCNYGKFILNSMTFDELIQIVFSILVSGWTQLKYPAKSCVKRKNHHKWLKAAEKKRFFFRYILHYLRLYEIL